VNSIRKYLGKCPEFVHPLQVIVLNHFPGKLVMLSAVLEEITSLFVRMTGPGRIFPGVLNMNLEWMNKFRAFAQVFPDTVHRAF
jgi:hypothetical protein